MEQQSSETQPAAAPLYFTGHQDGRVRVWDMSGEVPGLLATVPFDAGGAGGKLRAVCAMQVLSPPNSLLLDQKRGPSPFRSALPCTLFLFDHVDALPSQLL